MAATKRTHSGTAKEPSHHKRTADKDPPGDPSTKDVETKDRPKPGTGADAYFHNLYRSEIDFRQLAHRDPAFAKLLKQGHLDFGDPKAVVQLTKTLLKVDYGLEIDLPPDRLCPPVPNRHNYILWLKGLMDSTSYEDPDKRRVIGVDIGTGASCIYPLLGTVQRDWSFIATDIDETSLRYAEQNVACNNLSHRIRLVPRRSTDNLIPLDDLGVPSASFTMTNPPFYESREEMASLAAKKARPPLTACTGSPTEMVTEGGEVGFASRLLEESLVLKERVGWYSTMLGKFSSLEAVVAMLRDEGVENYAVTEFVQGTKTRRWAVAWSFGDMRPDGDVARGMEEPSWVKLLPLRTEHELTFREGTTKPDTLGKFIDDLLSGLHLSWEWDAEKLSGLGRAPGNVWGRAWRRRQQRIERGEEAPAQEDHDKEPPVAIGFRISVLAELEGCRVVLRWVQGRDAALVASLVGFLKGRLEKFRETDVSTYVVE